MSDKTPADPLDGQEVAMLNTMLAKVYPLAREGDGESIDRVVKILTLKRRYREDRRSEQGDWRL
jgi:hypothetical protein